MKRWCLRLLISVVVVSGLIPLTAGASWACSCAGSLLTESQEFRSIAAKAPNVYVADVVGRTGGPRVDPNGFVGPGTYRYELRVVRSLKGQASGTRYATTSTQGSACGVVIDERRPILVYNEQLSLCGGSTQERVQQRAAIVRAAVRGEPVTHVVARGEWLWQIARAELAVQSRDVRAPSPAAVQRAVRRLYALNRAAIGPQPDRLEVGTRLRVPRLV